MDISFTDTNAFFSDTEMHIDKKINISLEKKKKGFATVIKNFIDFIEGDDNKQKIKNIEKTMKTLKKKLGTNGAMIKDDDNKYNGDFLLFGNRISFVIEYLINDFKISKEQIKTIGFS